MPQLRIAPLARSRRRGHVRAPQEHSAATSPSLTLSTRRNPSCAPRLMRETGTGEVSGVVVPLGIDRIARIPFVYRESGSFLVDLVMIVCPFNRLGESDYSRDVWGVEGQALATEAVG